MPEDTSNNPTILQVTPAEPEQPAQPSAPEQTVSEEVILQPPPAAAFVTQTPVSAPLSPSAPSIPQSSATPEESLAHVPTSHVSMWKLAAYFIIGFLFSVFALIPAILWLVIRKPAQRKKKAIALTIGFFSQLIVQIIFYALTPYLIVYFIPESTAVRQALAPEFTKVNFGFNKNWVNGVSTSTFIVSVDGSEQISPPERQEIGQRTCDALAEAGKDYDQVEIQETSTKFLILHFSIAEGRTCPEWRSEPPVDVLQQLKQEFAQ